MKRIPIRVAVALCVSWACLKPLHAQVVFPVGADGEITFTAQSGLTVSFPDGTRWGDASEPGFALRTKSGDIPAVSVRKTPPGRLNVGFKNGASADFRIVPGNGFVLFQLEKFSAPADTEIVEFEMGRIALPLDLQIDSTLGRASDGKHFVALSTASLQVRPASSRSKAVSSDRAGCSHTFTQAAGRTAGVRAATFTATCGGEGGGWSYRSVAFDTPKDLTGLKAIRAVVHGDGQGQSLKIQPADNTGAARDTYIPIDFTGWKECSVAEAPYNKIENLDKIARLGLYYNGLPAGKTVACRIERIEAVCERDGVEQVILLEDFQDSRSAWWTHSTNVLRAEAAVRHGLDGSAFGILLGSDAKRFLDIMPGFEVAAGLPSPRFNGVWNKRAPDVRRSYFFLTNFDVSEFGDALAIAKRGGFDRILILQNSWTRATGHYEVNTKSFPGGLPQLADTVRRFQDAGFKTGFHFLAASIDPPDTYLTPVPEARLVYGVEAKLAGAVAADAAFLPTAAAPTEFPKEDGGYEGHGCVLRIGDELITYAKLKTDAPFGFEGCRRGHLGTRAAEHPKDAAVRHLTRSYGYHRIDLDTDLLPEIAAHFAKVANACKIDMMYFDGSEWLQGEHWYYNAKLQKAFYDAVEDKNMLMQGSSYSPYSWHQLARAASADGHGDLKGYLDQRSPGFAWMSGSAMPLDIGWYYAYDVNSTIDMYEYILLATLAYDSSMSLQVSVGAAHKHPFIGELLDKIRQFEGLRLSGRITPELREQLKINPQLGGKKPEEIAASFAHLRKEYRLLGAPGKERLQRVVYTPWQKVTTADEAAWDIEIPENLGAVRVGLNVHLLPDAKERKLVNPFVEIGGKRIALDVTLTAGQYVFQWPGEATRLYGPPLKDVSLLPESGGDLKDLQPGRHTVRFGAAEQPPCRARITLQPAESIAL